MISPRRLLQWLTNTAWHAIHTRRDNGRGLWWER